jgi:hypothetical protein
VVQPRLTELVTRPDDRPALIGQLIRDRYPEAVELGKGNATTGELVEVFKDSYGVAGDTARKAISFYLAAAKYAGDIRLSPNFKTPTNRSGTPGRRRTRPVNAPSGTANSDNAHQDIPTGLHPALAGLLGDIPKRGTTWTQTERDDFMVAFEAILKIAAPIDDDPASDDSDEE